MFDFHEKRKIRTILYSKGVLGLFIIINMFLIYTVFGVYQKERDTNLKKDQRASVFSELEIRKDVLSKEVERLSTERGIEEEIRSKFDVAKEGERVIVIVEPEEKEPSRVRSIKPSLWNRILNIFR